MSVFQGLKVLDFTWVVAGPIVTKCLADFGATVVRVESMKRPDILRYSAPYKDGQAGIDRSGYFAIYNTNKYSLRLNLQQPKGLEIARRLVAWSDVVAENFVPGMMEKWGLGFDDLEKIKPGIIMLRSSQQGGTGPYAKQPGYGPYLNALSGFVSLTGWPDGSPIGPHGAHCDFIGARFAIVALVAALIYRKKTGKGQSLDLSQLECGLHFLAPAILDYEANGVELTRKGNATYYAPHNAYRCRGDDRWCAIAIKSGEEWQSFCEAMGSPSWTREDWCNTPLGRKTNEELLDKLIEAWTVNFTPEQIMTELQRRGISAGVLKDPRELVEDPQLNSSGYFWWMEHSELGNFPYLGQAIRLSRTPAEPKLPSPLIGEHTEFVCKEILSMTDSELVACMNEGVFD